MKKSEMFKFFSQRLSASPQMCRAIVRAVSVRGSADEREVSALVRPPDLVEAMESQFEQSLDIARELGMLTGTKRMTVAEEFAEVTGDLNSFRRGFSSALVRHARNAIDHGSEPSDLFQGLVWLSLQPHTAAWEGGKFPKELSDLHGEGFGNAIVNDDQWRGLREWSVALGFARDSGSNVVVPDFSVAVGNAVDRCGPLTPVNEFLATVCESVPSLYDPATSAWYSATRPMPESVVMSPVLSWSLARLQRGRRIKLSQRDDAPTVIRFAAPLGPVSHVEVSK